HDFEGHFADLEFLPESLSGTRFYEPDEQNAAEAKIAERIRTLWKGKY
ncbi:MAG: replication-associated recombination protein A, partial [Alistipes sp.]|nr:replication-associated recombination protein A [Alistipes sp.]